MNFSSRPEEFEVDEQPLLTVADLSRDYGLRIGCHRYGYWL